MRNNSNEITTDRVLAVATEHLNSLIGHTFDVINISQPKNEDYTRFLAKVISKLSPIVGNMIEEQMSSHLNTIDELQNVGSWIRQDPGFPDNIFQSHVLKNTPGIEVKAWFPLATEITARFKTSQNLLSELFQTGKSIKFWTNISNNENTFQEYLQTFPII